ncbi:hypothetical protein lbkm_1350 [Lachnospiraceae bacterium KM106-2]|nr:hypothetical protein lbkm_1350 [Lachnospiraceae bacterium KM106-2]
MNEMTILKALYDRQKEESLASQAINCKDVHMTEANFQTALTSLQEHGYISGYSKDTLDQVTITKKGMILGKELL